MLPKPNRLPHSTRLYRGQTLSLPCFIVKSAANNLSSNRFGVVISKKVDKRAVKRNRMRRLLHSFIHEHPDVFSQGYDYLFIVTRLFDDLSPELQETLENYFATKRL